MPRSHPCWCQGRPQHVRWGSTPPVIPAQLHWAKAFHGSWGPWEPQCCHLPFGPLCGGLGTSLYCAGVHWDSPSVILEQCQSCREKNALFYWDTTEA